MSRLIDKILIHCLSIFAMCYLIHGNTFVVIFYSSIIISAVNYYLISREDLSVSMRPESTKEWIALIFEMVVVFICLFFPPAIVIMPVIMYDICRSRNYPGAALVTISLINNFFFSDLDARAILYIFVVLILSVVLSIYTEEKNVIKKDYRKLRDDSEEKGNLLKAHNSELIQARDTEIHNAQLAERNRIAREIHDNVGHTLSRAILQMGALLAIHKEEPVHSELEGVRQTLDDAMNNIRSSVHNLHDDSIDVAANIRQLSEPLKQNYKLSVDIDIGQDMPRTIKYAVIGITKECISNIIKHSHNEAVDIKLYEHPSMYQLIIHDYTNKDSSDTSDQQSSKTTKSQIGGAGERGMGLENIQNRADSVDGTLNISSDNGFRIFVTIPIRR